MQGFVLIMYKIVLHGKKKNQNPERQSFYYF